MQEGPKATCLLLPPALFFGSIRALGLLWDISLAMQGCIAFANVVEY